MKTILLDTNALMAIGEFHLDVFTALQKACDFPYKIAILQGTLQELQEIASTQGGKYARAATLALELVKRHKVEQISPREAVDKALVDLSQQGMLVLTQDRALKKMLKKPYLTIRQKKRILLVR